MKGDTLWDIVSSLFSNCCGLIYAKSLRRRHPPASLISFSFCLTVADDVEERMMRKRGSHYSILSKIWKKFEFKSKKKIRLSTMLGDIWRDSNLYALLKLFSSSATVVYYWDHLTIPIIKAFLSIGCSRVCRNFLLFFLYSYCKQS